MHSGPGVNFVDNAGRYETISVSEIEKVVETGGLEAAGRALGRVMLEKAAMARLNKGREAKVRDSIF